MKLYKIKKSKIDNKGRGLYAAKDIKAGTKIINYIGKILTNKASMSLTNLIIVNQFIYSLSIKNIHWMGIFLGIQQA